MFGRRSTRENATGSKQIPAGIVDLLEVVDAEYLLLAPGEIVVRASDASTTLGLVRDGKLVSNEILNIVRACRRSQISQEDTIELPRGPIGEGTHNLLVRVAPVGNQGIIAVLIFDDSEFRRLDAVRRDFVANISHELKTPIGALSILSEAVLEASDDPVAITRFASRMQTEAKRLSDLVQEIINLSRIQDEDPLKNATPILLSDLILQAIDESRLTAESREIKIDFIKNSDSTILGEESQLEMAISNLIENAINYSPNKTNVVVSLNNIDGLAEIKVKDQGIGISNENIERIFERFYRVDPARSRATGGTGLGLSIVKHIITNHGGDISVWSEEGEGSTFTLRLPEFKEAGDLQENLVSVPSLTEEK
ncbi:MAG: histidine kinase [Actinobacteria bacterium]|jgi:two-component system sensor histidine kinase SenX3|nr:histidine kinase [Actinomycetota bacterium]NDH81259.1 histidine kinase [Actinomycetota bacterium]